MLNSKIQSMSSSTFEHKNEAELLNDHTNQGNVYIEEESCSADGYKEFAFSCSSSIILDEESSLPLSMQHSSQMQNQINTVVEVGKMPCSSSSSFIQKYHTENTLTKSSKCNENLTVGEQTINKHKTQNRLKPMEESELQKCRSDYDRKLQQIHSPERNQATRHDLGYQNQRSFFSREIPLHEPCGYQEEAQFVSFRQPQMPHQNLESFNEDNANTNINNFREDLRRVKNIEEYCETLEERNKCLSVELEKQRIKNLQYQKVISIFQSEEKNCSRVVLNPNRQNGQNFSANGKDLRSAQSLNAHEFQRQNRALKLENLTLRGENKLLQSLVYTANQSYQQLEEKFASVSEIMKVQRQESDQREKEYAEKMSQLKLIFKELVAQKVLETPQEPFAYNKGRDASINGKGPQKSQKAIKSKSPLKLKDRNVAKQEIDQSSKRQTEGPIKPVMQTAKGKKQLKLQQLNIENSMPEPALTTSGLCSPTAEENYRKLFLKTLSRGFGDSGKKSPHDFQKSLILH